jgi:gluconolactonase
VTREASTPGALVLCAIILALSPGSLAAQDFEKIQAERIVTGLQFADGIVWSRDGFLVFADVVKRKMYRVDPGTPPKPALENTGGTEGLAYDTQGRLYMCQSTDRRVTRMDRHGKTETIADMFEGKKLNAPNDIVVRHDGNVYFTDPAFASAIEARQLAFNGIFHVTPKGELDVIAKWQTRPNGIALSSDGKTLFVTDSDRHAVVAFDLDGRGGAGNPRDLIKNIEGVPGGLRTDVNGHLYVAEKGLAIYSPGGKLEQRLLAGESITNCAFGDNDFQTLYVTGRKNIYRIRLGVKGAIPY